MLLFVHSLILLCLSLIIFISDFGDSWVDTLITHFGQEHQMAPEFIASIDVMKLNDLCQKMQSLRCKSLYLQTAFFCLYYFNNIINRFSHD